MQCTLTLSWQRSLSYRNQSINLLCKSMEWFLYVNGLSQERVNARKFSWHGTFAVFLNNLCTLRHFNFVAQHKYCILRFDYVTIICDILVFAVVLKIEFFMCMNFQHFRNFGKSMESNCKLNFKHIFIFLLHTAIHKSNKNSEKLLSGSKISSSSWSESKTGFTNSKIWRFSSGVPRNFAQ